MKTRPLLWITVSVSVFFPMLGSWAVETGRTQTNASRSQATQANPSEEVPSQRNRFTQSEWGLDDTEWQRYQRLIGGVRGSISQTNISPLEVLGIHAETDAEQRDYAKRLAKAMHDDTKRVLAFARVYQEESSKLYPNAAIIDKTRLPSTIPASNAATNPLQPGDRILFFTRTGACDACRQQLAALASATQRASVQLDVYVVGAGNDEAIRSWAATQPFDRTRLANKTLTLNHDQGNLTKLAGPSGTAPLSLLLRGSSTLALNPFSLP
jgi:integrating conjugative element protein (TIGR03759 family)